jgi:hypothetical protein
MRFPHIYEFVLCSLGHPTVKVELTSKQIELCVEEAAKKWVQYQGYDRRFALMETKVGINGYELPRDVNYPKEDLLEVYYSPDNVDFDDMSLYLLINQYYYYFRSSSKQLMTDYTMFKGYIEDLHRTLATYGPWELINNRLFLYPLPRQIIKYMIVYKSLPVDEEIDNNQWMMRYSRALAKGILGQVRGKFTGGIPGPSGNITLNYSDLFSQSDADREKLLVELRARDKPIGIITG